MSPTFKKVLVIATIVALALVVVYFFPDWDAEARHFVRQLARFVR